MASFEASPIPGARFKLGEGTLWDERSNRFLWVDLLGGEVAEYAPESGDLRVHDFGDFVSYIGKRRAGGYIIALGDQLALIDNDFVLQKKIDMGIDIELLRTNDGNIDPSGALWMGLAEVVPNSKRGELRRYDRHFNFITERRNVQISNGIDWSLDGKIMYYIDSAPREISRYQFDPIEGAIIGELPAIDVSDVIGVPDGMCTDSLGNLWVAFWGSGQVRNYSPEGDLLNIVKVPTALATCASFGGSAMQTMLITTARDEYSPEYTFASSNGDTSDGMCFTVELPVVGKPDNFFLG